jgi:hypothetical protein
MADDPKPYTGEAPSIEGLDPTVTDPRDFLMQIVQKTIGDKRAQGDEINPVDSPIDYAAGAAGAKLGSKVAGGLIDAASSAPVRSLVRDEAGQLRLGGTKATAPSRLMNDGDEAARIARAEALGFDTSKTYYHGTKADIDAFDPQALGASTNANSARQGYFFASDPSTASDYADLSPARSALRGKLAEPALQKDIDTVQEALAKKYGDKWKEPSIYDADQKYNSGAPGIGADLAKDYSELHTRIPENEPLLKQLQEAKQKYGAGVGITPKTGLDSFYRDEELNRLIRSNPAEQQKYLDQLHKSAQFVQDRLDGKIVEKYPPPRDYTLSKLEEYKQKIANAKAELHPDNEKARLTRIAELQKEKAAEEAFKVEEKHGQNVIPVHLKMENPYIHDFKDQGYRDTSYSDIMKKAKDAGHDSVIFKNTYDPADPNNRVMQDIHAVFDPSQIRSKFGNFDPKFSKTGKLSFAEGGVVDSIGALPSASDSTSALSGMGITPTPQAPAPTTPAVPTDPNEGVNVINPRGEVVSIPQGQLHQALGMGYQQATEDQVNNHFNEQKYGTSGQMAKTALEGAAQAATFGLSSKAETALGIATPEDIRQRQETNPGIHAVGEIGSTVGQLFTGVGEAALVAKAASKLGIGAAVAKLGGGKFISQVGDAALKSAFETAAYQGHEEASDAFLGDPNQTASTVVSHLGMAAVLGGVLGGTLGALGAGATKFKNMGKDALAKNAAESATKAVEPSAVADVAAPTAEAPIAASPEAPAVNSIPADSTFVSGADVPKMEQGDFKTLVENTDHIPEGIRDGAIEGVDNLKPNVKEIDAAAERLGVKAHEGMRSADKLTQQAEDTLLHTPTTFSGRARQKLYNETYTGINKKLSNVLGDATVSLREAGDSIADGLTDKFAAANKPLKELFDNVKMHSENIPVDSVLQERVANEIKAIPEMKFAEDLPVGSQFKTAINGLAKVKSVDDIKTLSSMLSVSPMSAPAEKRIAAILRDKMRDLEEGSITAFAKSGAVTPAEKSTVNGLIDQLGEARKGYSKLMDDVRFIAKQTGRANVHGVQDAIQFLQENLSSEKLVGRLFDKKNSAFLEGFSKRFPQEMEIMRQYQKGALRDAASTTGELSQKTLFNKIKQMSPEIQRTIFSPSELQALKDSETLIRSMPKNFNPSGSSHGFDFRQFFSKPLGSAVHEARDKSIEAFITQKKMVDTFKDHPGLNTAKDMGQAAAKGAKNAVQGIESVFDPSKPVPPGLTVDQADTEKLKQQVEKHTKDPNLTMNIGNGIPLPQLTTPIAQAAATAVRYLSSIKPQDNRQSPLDPKLPTSKAQEANYNRALQIAQNPLSIIARVKDGTLNSADLIHLQNLAPQMHSAIAQQFMSKMADAQAKGTVIPYKTKIALSLFLAQPLSSTMTPSSIVAAQPKPAENPQNAPDQAKGRPSAPSLQKMAGMYQTGEQGRSQRSAKS